MLNSTILTNLSQGARTVSFLVKISLSLKKKLTQFLLITFVLFCTYPLSATNYYVSSSGSDSNAGTSEGAPWKTLAKVNSFSPKPGDQILFKRGDEWIGNVTVNASGTSSSKITYGAYGTGNKPKIYGSEVITGWTKHSGNIYKASFKTDITQLFVNGVKMKLARLSNTGYNIVNSVTSQTQFTCNTLDAGFNYAGATVMLKTENYFSVMRTVSSSSSKNLSINSAPAGTIKVNQGFLLMNKLEFLDSAGEWYYDAATDMVYVWTPAGDSPANYEVRSSTLNEGIIIDSKNYITVNNLNILQQKEKGLNILGGNIIIDSNLIEGQEGFGIWSESLKESIVQNNIVDAVNGIGIYIWIENSAIRDNTVTNIGVFDKLGLNGTWNDNGGTGMEISGNGNTIEYNRISEINYNGIFWRGNSILQYNFIKTVCLYKSDGGGIYTGGTSTAGSTVRYNIIDNSVGNKEGGITSRNMSEGIFLDEPSKNITCEYNTIIRCSNSGIMMFKNENHVVRNNTIMDARYGIFAAQSSGTVKSNITGNIIVTSSDTDDYEPRQLTVRYASANATFDNNTYVCPFSSDLVFRPSDGSYKNFANWKSFIAGDANSTFIGTALKTGETQEMFYNDTKQTKTINLGSYLYKDIYGKQVSQSFTLEPFTSKILTRATTVIAIDTNPPTISSFSIPSTLTSLTVPVSSFTATDNTAVTGYKLTESATAPLAGEEGWTTSAPSSYTFNTEGTKTLYAWTKDAAGNVSTSKSDQVVITSTNDAPVLLPLTSGNTEVLSLATSSTLRRAIPVTLNETGQIQSISVYHNAGTGNVLLGVYSDVAGFPSALLGVTPSTTVRNTQGWQTVSLTTPVTVTSGQKVWLAWVFQNTPYVRYQATDTPESVATSSTWSSGMTSTFGSNSNANFKFSVYCTYTSAVSDITKPVINAFTIPATASALTVAVSSFTATDNTAVTGYKLTESATAPLAGDAGWTTSAPSSYTFNTEGTKTLYAWTKDAAGNVSVSKSTQIVINLPDVTKPVITAFTIPTTSSSLVILVSSFTATDNTAVTAYKLTESATAPLAGDAGWSSSAQTSYSFATEGTKTLYAWTKDAAGNVSVSKSVQVVITLPDVTKPVITAFAIPVTSTSLVVLVSSFTATDNTAVTGYKLTESATAPLAGDAGWSSSAQTSYSFVTEGTKTLYAWTKDAAGNVSTSKNAQVVITLPDVTKPVITAFTIPTTSSSLVILVSSFTATDNVAVTAYKLTESATAPLAGDAGWSSSAQTSYSFATVGTKTLYAWTKDAAGNVSVSKSVQVVITLPDVTKPVITAFAIPVTSTSLFVLVSSFTATDNTAVTGYKLTESATAPLAGDAGWSSSAQTSYSFVTEGTKTLYAWTKDAAGNVSTSKNAQVVITLPDVTKPVITAFTIPDSTEFLTIPITSFDAVDDKEVTGYMVSETNSCPLVSNSCWSASAPKTYTFSGDEFIISAMKTNEIGLKSGTQVSSNYVTSATKELYAWTKDAAGNISTAEKDEVLIIFPDVEAPEITEFTIQETSSALIVDIINLIATDNTAVTGLILTETSTAPEANDKRWADSVPASFTFVSQGTKTLYAWAKDAAGNVSTSKNAQVVINLPDVTKPVITAFTIPATSSSLFVLVSSFTATDNVAVIGFKLTESATAPLADDADWNTSAQTSYSFATEGTKTLYAWTKDAAGNVSVSKNAQVVITLPDVTKPVITAFTIPATSSSLFVLVSSFTATDNVAVIGFKLTESATAPLAGDADWSVSAPTSYTFATEGIKTLYAWTKDAAGNVSTSISDQIEITLNKTETTTGYNEVFSLTSTDASRRAMPVSFSEAGSINSISVYHNGGTGNVYMAVYSDASGSPSSILGITASTLVNSTAGWQTIPLSSSVAVSSGQTVWLAWVFQTNPGIKWTNGTPGRASSSQTWSAGMPATFGTSNYADYIYSVYCTYAPDPEADITKPTVTAFTIPATTTSLTVTVSSFTATDNTAVTGYKLTESATAPLTGDTGWSSSAPTSYTFVTEGTKILYAWSKDAAGNVSASESGQVVITLPDVTKPVITAFAIPVTSSSLVVLVSSFTATDNTAVAGYKLTESATAPLTGDAGWSSSAPTSYTFGYEGTKTLYAWTKDAAGNVSASISGQVALELKEEIVFPPITEESPIVHSIELRKGWNIISTYLIPVNENMDSTMEALRLEGNLVRVQDEFYKTYEKSKLSNDWINNIGKLQKTKGYKIKVESDCILKITGSQIQLPLDINIKRGWNLISFPINGSIDAMKVIQPLIDAGILYKIQDEKGNSIENWQNLGWKNGIGNFNAGEGYILQANKNGVLTLNDLSSKSSYNFAERSETSYFNTCYDGNGINHMNINLVKLNEANLQIGDEIAAFDGEICVGAIKLNESDIVNNAAGMAVSASELNEFTGFTEGNQIQLKIWKNENGKESEFQPEVIEGEMIFNKQASVFGSLQSQSTNVVDLFENLKIDVYPNPASNNVTIRFSTLPVKETRIILMDILGNEVYNSQVQNTQENINIQNLPVGMYIIKTELYDNYRIQKLIKK